MYIKMTVFSCEYFVILITLYYAINTIKNRHNEIYLFFNKSILITNV